MSMLGPESVVRRATHQTSADLGDERVLLNARTGTYYGLDDVGSRIWELLDEPRTVAGLRDRLLEEYDVDRETCAEHVEELLAELLEAGLIAVEAAAS